MRISRVCVAHSTMLHLCSNACSTPYLCACVCVCACVCTSIKNERPVRANERWRETVIETLGRVGDERWGGVGAPNGKTTLPALPLFSPWIEAVRFPGKHSWRGGSTPCLSFHTFRECSYATKHRVRSRMTKNKGRKVQFQWACHLRWKLFLTVHVLLVKVMYSIRK